MDFTVKKYRELLSALISNGYSFQTFEQHLKKPEKRSVILRHDVDLLPFNSLFFAKIQNKENIKGVYYFRAVPESWNEQVIKEISSLGHEIGYHYECLTTCRGDFEKGIKDFERNLTDLRKLAPVTTICMHGSPLSKHDSKDLWNKYNYRNYGIIGEPYFDLDFNKLIYLTDTGRRWDGGKVSVRDKVKTNKSLPHFHTTDELIDGIESNALGDQVMFTFHPQRWSDNLFVWSKEFLFQNVKNVVKKYYFVKK